MVEGVPVLFEGPLRMVVHAVGYPADPVHLFHHTLVFLLVVKGVFQLQLLGLFLEVLELFGEFSLFRVVEGHWLVLFDLSEASESPKIFHKII